MVWILRLARTALLAALTLPAFCQGHQLTEIKQIPDYVLYDMFFRRVVSFDAMAASLTAQGGDGSVLSSSIKRHAGLTSQEESDLRSIASACEQSEASIVAQVRSLAAAGLRPGDPQVQQLLSQRLQVIADSVGKLQAAFEPARFVRLDVYVRGTTKVRRFQVTPAAR